MMRINRGDLLPDLVADLSGTNGPVDLTTAAIEIVGYRGGVEVIRRTVTGTSQGVVTMQWQAGDTGVQGMLGVKWEVTWPGGKMQTFPVRGLEWVEITPDPGQQLSELGLVPVPGEPGFFMIGGSQ